MSGDPRYCERCGRVDDQPHDHIEGDCILPHNHLKPKHPPLATIGRVCDHCFDRWGTALVEIVELFATLADVVEVGSVDAAEGEHGGKKRKPSGSPALMRLEAWAMLYDKARLRPKNAATMFTSETPNVPAVLAGWVSYLYEDQRVNAEPANNVTALCNTLSTYRADIAESAWVDDFDAELRWLGIALRRVHGIPNPRPLGDCLNKPDGTECKGHVWRQEEGPPRCDRCGRKYERQDLVRLELQVKTEQRATA